MNMRFALEDLLLTNAHTSIQVIDDKLVIVRNEDESVFEEVDLESVAYILAGVQKSGSVQNELQRRDPNRRANTQTANYVATSMDLNPFVSIGTVSGALSLEDVGIIGWPSGGTGCAPYASSITSMDLSSLPVMVPPGTSIMASTHDYMSMGCIADTPSVGQIISSTGGVIGRVTGISSFRTGDIV